MLTGDADFEPSSRFRTQVTIVLTASPSSEESPPAR
jgi:hypothetical protein